VRWLWWPFVPQGKITAIAGQMGQAKSLWTLWLAAAVTRGQGINLKRPGSVLILSAEDDPEDTTVPRLIAAGADLGRVHFLPDFTLDADELQRRCEEIEDVRLIVVDPLSAYLGEKVDSWKSQHVRRALEPVRRLAQESAIAAVIVQHLNRRGDTPDALARIADSQSIPALARSVLLWGPNPADPEGDQGSLKVLTRAKMNLARGCASAAFQIEEVAIPNGIRPPRLVHIGESDARAEDVTADADTRTKRAEAIGFLREHLADGPVEVEKVKQAATEADISEKPLREARERVCRSYRPGGNHGPYVWALKGIHEDGSTKGKGIQGHSGSFTGVNAVDAVDDHISVDGNGRAPDGWRSDEAASFAAELESIIEPADQDSCRCADGGVNESADDGRCERCGGFLAAEAQGNLIGEQGVGW
jgi:putative DNA primase/helicase